MIVENTTARLLVIPPSGVVDGTQQAERISLPPGFSKVNDDDLACILGIDNDGRPRNKCVQKWFDMGMLVAHEKKAEIEIPPTLSGVKAKDSIAFVKRNDSVTQLEEWLGEEERATVRKAIEAKLAELN